MAPTHGQCGAEALVPRDVGGDDVELFGGRSGALDWGGRGAAEGFSDHEGPGQVCHSGRAG